jgi:hypothetical protein
MFSFVLLPRPGYLCTVYKLVCFTRISSFSSPPTTHQRSPSISGNTGFDIKKSSNRRTLIPSKRITSQAPIMAEWDLSQKIIPYLDRHLAFPLLAYLTETGLFPAEEVQVAQYELARKTNMVDFAVSLFEAVYPGKEIPGGEFHSPVRARERAKRLIVARSFRVQREETRGTVDEREVAAGSSGGFGRD